MPLTLRVLPWAAAISMLLAGCPAPGAAEATDPDPIDYGDPASLAECISHGDCEPAASACCECPSFALPVSDGFGEACGDIGCQAPSGCPEIQAACVDGACTLRCAPVVCDITCEAGFAADELGCLVCACAELPPQAIQCQIDTDCAQVPADCCGCARGGHDTAVPVSQVQAHIEALDCPLDPACPDIDTCMENYIPRCIQGTCALATPDTDTTTPDEPQRCGLTSLPSCPQGQVCVLNDPAAPQATESGTGVCRDPAMIDPS
jgi:hypothetical protein